MKRIFYRLTSRLASVILLVSIAFTVTGQVADFSGSWKLNPSKSKLNEQFSMAPKEMILTLAENSLMVERHAEFQDQKIVIKDNFTLDGKECKNEGWQGTVKKSVAAWSEDKKSLTVKTKIPMENSSDFNLTETFRFDGVNLVVEASATSDWGTSSETYAFDKQ